MKQKMKRYTEYIDKHAVLLFGILSAAAFLRFKYAFFDGMWIDEGRYGRIALSVSHHLLDYSVTGEWLGQISGFPPLYSYLLAASMLVFGRNEFAIRIVSPLMSLLGIGLIYVFGTNFKDRETGLIAAALLTVSPIFWFLSVRILIGAMLTTMFIATMLALYYGLEERTNSKYAIWALAPLTVLTILTKQPGYALGVIIPVYWVYKKRAAFREAWIKRKIRGTELEEQLTDRNYYISAGIALIITLPWMLRNTAVCGIPFCSLKRALMFAGKDVSGGWVATHIQGIYFFVKTLPIQLTLPVFVALIGRVIYGAMKSYSSSPRKFGYLTAGYFVGLAAVFIVNQQFTPMWLLTGLALFAKTDFEKLAWIWAGVGIGFMSIPAVKDPRYIVFAMPALLMVASIGIRDFAVWISERLGRTSLKTAAVTAVLMAPMLFASYSSGIADVKRGGYSYLEPAGKWMDENAPLDSNVIATSNDQNRYYTYPRMAYMPPNNKSEFKQFLIEKNISYVEADVYEPAQPNWFETDVAPYRVPESVKRKLRRGELSRREVLMMFQRTPEYLVPVRKYGKTRNPLTGRTQPVVIVYRVNRTALR